MSGIKTAVLFAIFGFMLAELLFKNSDLVGGVALTKGVQERLQRLQTGGEEDQNVRLLKRIEELEMEKKVEQNRANEEREKLRQMIEGAVADALGKKGSPQQEAQRTQPPISVAAPPKPSRQRRGPYSPQLDSRGTSMGQLDEAVHRWYLGVCASTAYSSAWLQEWLELMLISGVGHVWVINDNKPGMDDRTAEILEEYEKRGFVTVKNAVPAYHPGCGAKPNCIAPKTCYEITHKYTDHFIFADTDEFIFPRLNCNLEEHIRDHCNPDMAHETIRWERFGTSGHIHHPTGLMTENFLSSGGDCIAHTAQSTPCIKQPWGYCMECRHTKTMYNTKCMGVEHVGHAHVPANTSWFKRHAKFLNRGGITQAEPGSIYHDESCIDQDWIADKASCVNYTQRGGGSRFPAVATSDCCVAGIGYNHYGTKSLDHWNIKMSSRLRRGNKVPWFEVVEQNTTVSSNVLRFVRALRQRWSVIGLETAGSVSFIDQVSPEGAPQSTFLETGWQYVPNPTLGTVAIPTNFTTTTECASACWSTSDSTGRCGGFTFRLSDSTCALIWSPFLSWRHGGPYDYIRWPHATFTAHRIMDPGYASGIPLYEGECPLPDKLRDEW